MELDQKRRLVERNLNEKTQIHNKSKLQIQSDERHGKDLQAKVEKCAHEVKRAQEEEQKSKGLREETKKLTARMEKLAPEIDMGK